MKKYILLFIFLCAVTIIYLSFPLRRAEHFVSISDHSFMLDKKPFYPIALNYIVTMQGDKEGNIWPSSFNGYNAGEKYQYTTKDSCIMQLKAEMDLIREMGFNTIRVVRIGEEMLDEKTGNLSVGAMVNNEHTNMLSLEDNVNYKKYAGALAELFDLADKAGLKVIFLVNVQPDAPSTEYHLVRLIKQFKDTPALMAYDLFNEPLYFDKKERNKEDVIAITKRWNHLLKMYAPHQLFTIGLEGIREVFEWDPNILDVDFVSLHPYQYEPEQVRNEIYWYGKYITKPWMIGETAISADNDSVSYETQRKFAEVTLKQAYNCGAMGYSWWQYKDVDWHLFHANFMGVVNWKGITQTKKPNIPLTGTVKPLVQEFQKFDATAPKGECECFKNYYNYTSNNAFRIVGKMTDEKTGEGIEGAVILGWNEGWSHSYHTITKPDGSFELLSDYPYYHWMASATRYSMIRGEVGPDTAKVADGIKTINFGVMKVSKLSL
jgi:hypothetical protein